MASVFVEKLDFPFKKKKNGTMIKFARFIKKSSQPILEKKVG